MHSCFCLNSLEQDTKLCVDQLQVQAQERGEKCEYEATAAAGPNPMDGSEDQDKRRVL